MQDVPRTREQHPRAGRPQPTTTFIYGLCEPDTGELRYIGKTNDPAKRLRQHLEPTKLTGDTHRATWLRSVIARGLTPSIVVLAEVAYDTWEEAERSAIAHHRAIGTRLVNSHPGGGDSPLTAGGLERCREANRGRIHTAEEKAKRSASQRARLAESAQRQKWRNVALANGNRPPITRGEANPFARFTDVEIVDMRERRAAGESLREIAERYSTSKTQVSYVTTGVTRRDAGGPITPRRIRQRLTDEGIAAVRARLASGESQAAIARDLGVSSTHICKIASGTARRAA